MAKVRETLTRCEIRWDECGFWWAQERKGKQWIGTASSRHNETKAAFIRRVVLALKLRIENGAHGFSLRICKKDGEYQSERTYPTGRDPRSKG